jgi:hypothetical protein
MSPAHGTTQPARRTLHDPLKGLGLPAVHFFIPFSFFVFKSVSYIEDFVHNSGFAPHDTLCGFELNRTISIWAPDIFPAGPACAPRAGEIIKNQRI